jgi:hypothetical protein
VKATLAIIILSIGVASAQGPPIVPTDLIRLPNSCLVGAVEYEAVIIAKAKLDKADIWARIVIATYPNNLPNHAFCAFSLRNADVWTYDILNGSRPANTQKRDLNHILEGLRRYDSTIRGGFFAD